MHGRDKETLTLQPYIPMNDYAGRAQTLLTGTGIGELPPLVQPELLREGRLVEIMPKWRFGRWDFGRPFIADRFGLPVDRRLA